MKTKHVFFSLIFLMATQHSWSQLIESPTLGSSVIMSQQIQTTLGEFSVSKHSNNGLHLTEGFHQGTLLMSDIDSDHRLSYEIVPYPNPTTEKIKFEGLVEDLDFLIQSVDGRKILTGKVNSYSKQIDVRFIAPGSYILSIRNKKSQQNNYKIIKS